MVSPLVSVVICFYNAEAFLEGAIQSVLTQTLAEWELLLVDDGSTDGSSSIARRYVRSGPQAIHYLEHEQHLNLGFAASRNLGYRFACGKYIASLDADDEFTGPAALAEQVAILEANPEAASAAGRAEYWLSWRSPAEEDVLQDLTLARDALVYPPTLVLAFLERIEDQPVKELVRRDVFLEVGGFDESLVQFEDAAFSAKVALRHPVFISRKCWYRYRIHPDSSWQREVARGRADLHFRRFIEWLNAYLAGRPDVDPAVLHAARRQLRWAAHPRLRRLWHDRVKPWAQGWSHRVRSGLRYHFHRSRLERDRTKGKEPATGRITVDPNSVVINRWLNSCIAVTLTWSSAGAGRVHVRAHHPRGPILGVGPAGHVTSDRFPHSPALFFLQDASRGRERTLDVACVRWTRNGQAVTT